MNTSHGFCLDTKASKAPKIKKTRRINTRTGEDYRDVPKGIGTGWDYNVGKVWQGPDSDFGEKVMKLPKPLRDAALDSISKRATLLAEPFR